MRDDINDILQETKNTIKDFSEGQYELDDVKNKYYSLLQRYKQVQDKLSLDLDLNLLGGILYNHNKDNFSLFSGIYVLTGKKAEPIKYYGDSSINKKVIRLIEKNASNIDDTKLTKILPDEAEDISHTIYILNIKNDYRQNIYITTLSSSVYFSDEKFYFISGFIKEILSMLCITDNLVGINFFGNVMEEVKKYINNALKDGYVLSASVFYLSLLDKILSHVSLFSILEVSNSIKKIIEINFPARSRVFMLSFKEYIVLTPVRRDAGNQISKRSRMIFEYNGITIPFKSKSIQIDENNSYHQLLKEIYNLQDTIL